MRKSVFDDLARTLATPMPRRRALRVLGGAIVVAAVPGFRPRRAQAHGTINCKGLTPKLCDNGKGTAFCVPEDTTCCYLKDLVVGCRRCFTCGNDRNLACIGVDKPCGKTCCEKGEFCASAERSQCCKNGGDDCGKTCCKENEFCASPKQSLCCRKGGNYCAILGKPGSGGREGKAVCCPPRTKCCQNDKRTDCCGPSQTCSGGQCSCPKDKRPKCGSDCCEKNEYCSKGQCCPKGEVNCGDGRCCDASDCCEGTCCTGPGRICAGGTCCPAGRVIGSGKSAKCCPPGTVGTTGGDCCPKSDRKCCEDGEIIVLCRQGQTCVRGVCQTL